MLPPCACTPPPSSRPLAAILNAPIRRNQNHWMSPWLIAVLSLERHTRYCSTWSVLSWHFPSCSLSLPSSTYNIFLNLRSCTDIIFWKATNGYSVLFALFVAGHDGSSKTEVIENTRSRWLNPPWTTLAIQRFKLHPAFMSDVYIDVSWAFGHHWHVNVKKDYAPARYG